MRSFPHPTSPSSSRATRTARENSPLCHEQSSCPHIASLLSLLSDKLQKLRELDLKEDLAKEEEAERHVTSETFRGSQEEPGIQEGSVSELELFRRGSAPVIMGSRAVGHPSGSQVAEEPANGPPALSEPVLISDGAFDTELNITSRLKLGRLFAFPKPVQNVDTLPTSFCAYNASHHGALFTSHWTFPHPYSNDVVVIAGTTRKGEGRPGKLKRRLELMSHCGAAPLEVVFSADGWGTLTYLGTFMPEGTWLPFLEENIGDMLPLFTFWKKVADPHRVSELRIRSQKPEHGLSYCLLKYRSFNREYFNSLQDIALETLPPVD